MAPGVTSLNSSSAADQAAGASAIGCALSGLKRSGRAGGDSSSEASLILGSSISLGDSGCNGAAACFGSGSCPAGSSCPGDFARRIRFVERAGAPTPRRRRASRGAGGSSTAPSGAGTSAGGDASARFSLDGAIGGTNRAAAGPRASAGARAGNGDAGCGRARGGGGTRLLGSSGTGSGALETLGTWALRPGGSERAPWRSSRIPNPKGSSSDSDACVPFRSGLVSDKRFFLRATKALPAVGSREERFAGARHTTCRRIACQRISVPRAAIRALTIQALAQLAHAAKWADRWATILRQETPTAETVLFGAAVLRSLSLSLDPQRAIRLSIALNFILL